MNPILLCILAVVVCAAIPATIYLVFVRLPALPPKSYSQRSPYGEYPRAPPRRVEYRASGGRGTWPLNPMNAAPYEFYASLLIQAPPTVFHQIAQDRRASDAEAGIPGVQLRQIFIGLEQGNMHTTITHPGPLAHSS
ncbi:hypothetical protein B0H17DRAFT_60782 [Mycena rosella]|uniref:Uncharacterized protein n=1 Tax=Mycena rosella TaxID=1033263 RepID=A0AAD7D6E9_MYCRO|nr:hypothetical protein B0H17DRAFT_60782 [Mycena rosella]